MIFLAFIFSFYGLANPVKKSDLNPSQENPTVPGTKFPIKEMNTAPTSPPIHEDKDKSRFTLKASKQRQEELRRKKSQQKEKNEN